MKIGELAKRSGLTAHTIRYYERIGLLPYANRDRSNQRDYDASILIWIEFLGRMKTAGMPIREMLRYASLRARGVATAAERRELLERQLALRDQTRQTELTERTTEPLIQQQTRLQKELSKLGLALAKYPLVESLIEQVKAASFEATASLFEEKKTSAVAQQNVVISDLSKIEKVLEQGLDASRADKSAAELESVRESVRINQRGFEIFFEHYAPGKTAAEVMSHAEAYFIAQGCGRHLMDMVLTSEGRNGLALPVEGLRYWLQPSPAPTSRARTTMDSSSENGRLKEIKQDGWTIDYLAYADAPATGVKRLNLSRAEPPLDIKLVLDQ